MIVIPGLIRSSPQEEETTDAGSVRSESHSLASVTSWLGSGRKEQQSNRSSNSNSNSSSNSSNSSRRFTTGMDAAPTSGDRESPQKKIGGKPSATAPSKTKTGRKNGKAMKGPSASTGPVSELRSSLQNQGNQVMLQVQLHSHQSTKKPGQHGKARGPLLPGLVTPSIPPPVLPTPLSQQAAQQRQQKQRLAQQQKDQQQKQKEQKEQQQQQQQKQQQTKKEEEETPILRLEPKSSPYYEILETELSIQHFQATTGPGKIGSARNVKTPKISEMKTSTAGFHGSAVSLPPPGLEELAQMQSFPSTSECSLSGGAPSRDGREAYILDCELWEDCTPGGSNWPAQAQNEEVVLARFTF